MKKYKYAFRENAKGVSAKDKQNSVSRADAMERYVFRKQILPLVEDLVNKDLLIDIGSGEGRYSEYFGNEFNNIIAVEPDEHRFNQTKSQLQKLKNVTCIHGTVSDIPKDQKADLLINIHVLQHIHAKEIEKILDFAGKQIKVGGLFVLAITKKTKIDYSWNIAWEDEEKSYYTKVSSDLFEHITAENLDGILPVKKLELEEVRSNLATRGFKIVKLVEYAPHGFDLKKPVIGIVFNWFYKLLPFGLFLFLASTLKFPRFEDIVIVAKKVS